MTRFLVRRIFEAFFALLGTSLVIFIVLHLDHLDPARGLLGKEWTPQRGAALDAKLGLNQPVPIQYVLWLRGLVQVGGIGSVILQALPPTLEILAMGAALAFIASVVIASLQMRHPLSALDRVLGTITGFLSAVPGFFIGAILLYLLAYKVALFPASAFSSPHASFLAWLYHQILPVLALALAVIGPWSRQLRASMDDVASSDYVRTARAKGVSERRIISRHVLRNALLPTITMVGLSLPTLINTLIALEFIYGINGAGTALIEALNSLLFASATTVALVFACVTVLGNLLADLAYGLVDPRVQYR